MFKRVFVIIAVIFFAYVKSRWNDDRTMIGQNSNEFFSLSLFLSSRAISISSSFFYKISKANSFDHEKGTNKNWFKFTALTFYCNADEKRQSIINRMRCLTSVPFQHDDSSILREVNSPMCLFQRISSLDSVQSHRMAAWPKMITSCFNTFINRLRKMIKWTIGKDQVVDRCLK